MITTLNDIFVTFVTTCQDVWYFVNTELSIPFTNINFTPLQLMLGAGLVAVLTYTIIKWITNII